MYQRTAVAWLAGTMVVVLPLALVGACSSDETDTLVPPGTGGVGAIDGGAASGGTGAQGGTTGTGGSAGTAGSGNTGGQPPCVPVICQNKAYACANCIDDDEDGDIDSADMNCLGPCDNNEDGLHGQIPGGGEAPCKRDCYFDGDTGSGNDKCYWDSRCDPLEPELPDCPYSDPPPPPADCPDNQVQECLDFCLPLVPNGCDCFGCCELPAESGDFVFIGAEDADGNPTCSIDEATNAAACPPCTPVEDCYNDCGHCELCLGKIVLPPDCFDPPDGGTGPDGGNEQCPGGEQPCGLPGQDPCPSGMYCVTGCCQLAPT